MKNKYILLSALMLLSGCVSIPSMEIDDDSGSEVEVNEEVNTTCNSTFESDNQNYTAGSKVECLETTDAMITDKSDNYVLEVYDEPIYYNLYNSGFEYSVNVYDSDGDGVVSTTSNEKYTTVINLKNTSGHDIPIHRFQIYLKDADPNSPIDIKYVATDNIDDSRLWIGDTGTLFANYITYGDEDYTEMELGPDKEVNVLFVFPKDDEITIGLTATSTDSDGKFEPARLSVTGYDNENLVYYFESSPSFEMA